MQGIYEIENVVDGKIYVGSSKMIERRWREHVADLNSKTHCNCVLQAAWDRHGKCSFVFRVIEAVDDNDQLIEREQWWLDHKQPFTHINGYNMSRTAGKVTVPRRPESTQKTANANRGKKRTPEQKEKMRAAKLGTKQSIETCRKRSVALLGMKRNRAQFSLTTGENHHRTHLKSEDVIKIKELADSGATCVSIAAMYGIDRTSVNNIKLCKTWKCVLNGRNN